MVLSAWGIFKPGFHFMLFWLILSIDQSINQSINLSICTYSLNTDLEAFSLFLYFTWESHHGFLKHPHSMFSAFQEQVSYKSEVHEIFTTYPQKSHCVISKVLYCSKRSQSLTRQQIPEVHPAYFCKWSSAVYFSLSRDFTKGSLFGTEKSRIPS